MANSPPASQRVSPEETFGYQATDTAYDEFLDETGHVRPHWRGFISALAKHSPREREGLAQRLDRQVRATGMVHDLFADPEVDQAQWRLNLAPFIISAQEWRWIESALKQRANLAEAIVRDLYGAQNLLRDGLVPPALIFSDPAYLYAAKGIDPEGGLLQFCAFDLARDASGTLRVVDTHAETPAGLGFVVANRVMHSDIADDIFSQCGVRRLASHFRAQLEAICARTRRSDPMIVLMTAGPDHDDYFSHAYFARYLGVPLVEGGDLRVVADRVFLKTLAGLKPVDGVIRCVEASKADPLELDPDGAEGPVGLVNACRKAPGLVANSLGTAVIENRGLGGYLPKICQVLLGEDLMLWDAPRWWLGDPIAQKEISASDEGIIIRPVREGTGRPGRAMIGRPLAGMSSAEREQLNREIMISGAGLVAERSLSFSTMPRFAQGTLQPQSVALRLFVGATREGGSVLAGGVAMAVDPTAAVALSASSGSTHDVWVLAEGPEKLHPSLWNAPLATERVDRSQRSLQSRVADNLFWLGRYLERVDWTLRLMRSALEQRRIEYFGSSAGGDAAAICLRLLLGRGTAVEGKDENSNGSVHVVQTDGTDNMSQSGLHQLAHALATSSQGDYSPSLGFAGIYRVASLTRDRLSLDAWRTVSEFQAGGSWHRRMSQASSGELENEIDDKLAAIATFGGHMHESMTRNYGWYFLDMGRRLERGYNVCVALKALFADEPVVDETESDRLRFMLELADSYITYRSRYRVEPKLPLLLDLLLIDEANPRSLAYQLSLLTDHLEAMPMANDGKSLPLDRRIALALQTKVRLANVEELSTIVDGRRDALSELFASATTDLPALSDAISGRYFRLVEEQPHRVLGHRSEPRQ